MNRSLGIHDYAVEQMNGLLTRLAFQVHRAAQTPGPDQIHDLRVSIRRFSQGLLLFAQFFPKPAEKKINKVLKRMMRLTSDIRDRDIALEFLMTHEHPSHRQRLEEERAELERRFAEMVRRWSSRDFSAKWRSALLLKSV